MKEDEDLSTSKYYTFILLSICFVSCAPTRPELIIDSSREAPPDWIYSLNSDEIMGYGENTSRIEALKNARLDIQEQIASAIETEVKSKLSVYSLEYKQHYENRIEITLQSKVDQSFFLNTPIYTESYWETINKKFRKNEINYYKYYLLAKISRGFIDTLRNIDQLEDNYRGAIIDSLLGPLNRLDLINNLDPMPLLNNSLDCGF